MKKARLVEIGERYFAKVNRMDFEVKISRITFNDNLHDYMIHYYYHHGDRRETFWQGEYEFTQEFIVVPKITAAAFKANAERVR